jgi:urocanate hydratase
MGRATAGGGTQSEQHGKSGPPVRAPRGPELTCQGWLQEAALRMLMNSLDPGVAEQPAKLIACGATGKVLYDWESYGKVIESLKVLKSDETLLVNSGRAAGVLKSGKDSARVIISDTNPEDSRPGANRSDRLEQRNYPVLGYTDSGSWTYVGTQSALPIAFQLLDAIGRKHFGGDLGGKLVVSCGMGAAGGALPLATGMLGAAFLGIDVDGERIQRRIRGGYCDYCVNTLDEALRILKNAVRQKQGIAVGLTGNCAEVIPELASRGVLPDILTDQTSIDDLLNGYIPIGLSAEQARALRHENREEYLSRARDSIASHFGGMLALQKLGSVAFEFGNNLRAAASASGVAGAESAFPDFVEAYLQPLLQMGAAPVRWVALSGEPNDIRRFDDLVLELFAHDAMLARWIPLVRKYVKFQGLPARVCWMNQDTRTRLAGRINNLVAEGAFKAPFVVAFGHAEINPEAKTRAQPAGMENDSAGSPSLDGLLNAASGASWVSLKCGTGYKQTTVAMVVDGTPAASKNVASVLGDDYPLRILRAGVGR